MNDDKEWNEILKMLSDLEGNKDRAFRPVPITTLLVVVGSFAGVFYLLWQVVLVVVRLFGG